MPFPVFSFAPLLVLVFLLLAALGRSDARYKNDKKFEGPRYKFSGFDKIRAEKRKHEKPDLNLPRGNPLTPRKPGEPLITSYGPSYEEGVLNVAVVPHSHDDIGWLKTVDQYYTGSNSTIYTAGVQFILDSVVAALLENPARKFIEVEIGFFKLWWDQQNHAMKANVRGLVKSGSLEFINGGWCMSDEAAPYYTDMIDQQACGHQFLLKEFGSDAIPKTGWQIDPFGHSAFMGNLYAQMGMDSWFFGRIDYQDRAIREANHTAEVIMRTSASLGAESDIFTGVTRGYGPLDGFDFEPGGPWSVDPMQDDMRLDGYNIEEKIETFVSQCRDQAKAYKTNNIMLTMGSDFCYQNANTWYKSLDKLIHYAQQDGRVNAFYSTPTEFTDLKFAADVEWPTKEDDWFPYADSPHSFWTGYFTSRPGLKGYVKTGSNMLQSCRQLEAQTFQPDSKVGSQTLWEAMGVAQHHDAVSGTSKQHVADDYAKQIYKGLAECEELVFGALNALIKPTKGPIEFQTCHFLNESSCDVTQSGRPVGMMVYNGLAQKQTHRARLPVKAGTTSATVTDHTGAVIPCDVIPTEQNNVDDASSVVVFNVDVPPMGYSAFLVEQRSSSSSKSGKPSRKTLRPHFVPRRGEATSISNDVYELTFDSSSGLLSQVTMKQSGQVLNVSQYFAWYNSSSGNVPDGYNPGQASGAYIFRPNCTEDVETPCDPWLVTKKAKIVSVTDSVAVAEVVQQFSNWVSQTIRLYKDGSGAIETQWTVGPIPVTSELGGMEVVSVWQTDLKNKQTWFTDSNGRDMQVRRFNFRPGWPLNVTDPVSGNFYPVNSALYFQDKSTRATFLVDRSQGGGMLRNGQVQLMLHRRINQDDHRGVGEALNETAGAKHLGLVVRGTHRVIFAPIEDSPALHKQEVQRINFPPLPVLTDLGTAKAASEWMASLTRATYTQLNASLPDNVHLMTMQDNSFYGEPNSIILRFVHLFEADEGAAGGLDEPVKVSLETLFNDVYVGGCVEWSISMNQKQSDIKRKKWKTQNNLFSENQSEFQSPGPMEDGESHFTLQPMQIRTFLCDYKVTQQLWKPPAHHSVMHHDYEDEL